MAARTNPVIERRALSIDQGGGHAVYVFTLQAQEILQIADVSRVSRDDAGKLIGYQRPEVRQHVQEIVDYLNGESVLFPNPVILALSPRARFVSSRGPKTSDGLAVSGVIQIPLPDDRRGKPAWIVDGQQRALALAKALRQDFPVPVNAFISDSVDVQRDQFLRINNTKPLPKGLVTELLPEVHTLLPVRLSTQKAPSELCDLLNQEEQSPFCGMIRRPSTPKAFPRTAVITDTSVVKMIETSLSTNGCLFPFRDVRSGETDYDAVWKALIVFWSAVKDTFPDAWGPAESRLMQGVGIRAMGRLMDRILVTVDSDADEAPALIRAELALIAPHCRWTEGVWEGLDTRWDGLQNTPRDIDELANFLIRTHARSRTARP
jgi:DGQHR domain-containing protein